MNTPKIGQSVVYQAGADDGPLNYRSGFSTRQCAALVAWAYPDGTLDLVAFPFGYYKFVYYQAVSRGGPEVVTRCWFLPEERFMSDENKP